MKRKALLIGNTRGLSGVQADMLKTRAFLESRVGGNWLPSEIVELKNPSRQELLGCIQLLKRESVDYAFVLFSGHGGHVHQTVLELNADGETINESDPYVYTDQLTRQLNALILQFSQLSPSYAFTRRQFNGRGADISQRRRSTHSRSLP